MSEQVEVRGPVEESTGVGRAAGSGSRSAGRRPQRWLAPMALIAGLLAVLATLLLPLAPVSMSQPVVSWPQSPSAPSSTMLQLTAQTPLSLDVRFSCAAARVAAGTADGVLLATVRPGQPSTGGEGLLVTAGTSGLVVESAGTTVLQGAPLGGNCSYQVSGDADQGLVVTRDGQVVGRGEVGRLPAVDVLATSVTALSPADGEQLSAELAVDDQFSTSPSPVKWALIVLVLLGAAGSVAFLLLEQRGTRRERAPAARRFGPLDVVVPLVMIGWLFLAPTSDDDGYYAAMARNSLDEGAVGNYYQLLNQNFTPFTWFYRLLGVWQQVGDSPAVLRVPALVTGLLTWVLLRRFTAAPGALPAVLQGSRRGRGSVVVVLALAYLAWWLPYGMGVRPEAVVGFLAVATMLAVFSALHRRSLPMLGLAVTAAAMSAVCHPTGFVALAPLLAGAPRIVQLLRDGVPARRAWVRGLAVLAPGAVAGIAAFGDGSLNDFRRGQEIFLSIQAQNSWFDEYQRYYFLFSPIPMGSYAKRIAVVLGIVALVWFALLAAASRSRRTASPQLLLAGQSLALGLLLLWITPSKWTHHFGALDGIGPAFLALFLCSVPVLVRALPGGIRNGPMVGAVAVGTTVLVLALSFHGPNDWAYSWLQGLPRPRRRPAVLGVTFDNLLVWLILLGGLVLVVRRFHRRLGVPRHRPWLTALPVAVSTALALAVLYLFGGFAVAAASTLGTYSPWADALTDPTGSTCGPAKAIDVPDLDAARPLVPAPAGAADTGGGGAGPFTAGGGFYPPSPPSTAPGTGAATQLWGSLRGSTDGSAVGGFTTPWFPLPASPADGDRVAVLVSGDLTDSGNELTAQYGRSRDGQVETVATATLADDTDSAIWRTRLLDVPAGADSVRLVGVDGTTDPAGWLAFTGPSVLPIVALSDQLPAGAPVATAWQYAFLFPCQRQLEITDGITEPMQYAVMRAEPGSDAAGGVQDATWKLDRGGLFAPTLRDSSVTLLGGRFRDFPRIDTVQVFQVVAPYPVADYDLRPGTGTRWGWQGPEESRWPYPAGLP